MRERRRVRAMEEMNVAGKHIAEGDEGTIVKVDDVLIYVRWDGSGRAIPMLRSDPVQELTSGT